MLTRTGEGTDIAPDASIFPEEREPTGHRKLEELAFEVTSEQALRVPTSKARELAARGVRRVFCILVEEHRVLEWSRQTDGWRTLPERATIEDRCLVRPLPVGALLDPTVADGAIVAALAARGSAAVRLLQDDARSLRRTAGRVEGKAEGRAEDVLAVLSARGIDVVRRLLGSPFAAQLEAFQKLDGAIASYQALLDSLVEEPR